MVPPSSRRVPTSEVSALTISSSFELSMRSPSSMSRTGWFSFTGRRRLCYSRKSIRSSNSSITRSLYNDCKVDEQLRNLFMLIKGSSPFILKPYFAFQDIENLYLVTEFVSGGDLGSILKYHTFTEA